MNLEKIGVCVTLVVMYHTDELVEKKDNGVGGRSRRVIRVCVCVWKEERRGVDKAEWRGGKTRSNR